MTMRRVTVGSDSNEHGIVDKETTVETVEVQGALALEELLFERGLLLSNVGKHMPAIPHTE